MGLFAVAWAGLIPLGGIWMGTVATASSAPIAVGIGAAVCGVYALVLIVRRVGTRPVRVSAQAPTDPPR